MAEPTPVTLGPGWLVTRGWVVACVGALALGWTGVTLSALARHRAQPLGISTGASLGISVLLILMALWCALGAETWHLAANSLEHRIGIGHWRFVRGYRDAELAIVRPQDRLDRPYYRLYAVTGGRQHFLLERGLSELNALAVLIGARTGWRQRDSV